MYAKRPLISEGIGPWFRVLLLVATVFMVLTTLVTMAVGPAPGVGAALLQFLVAAFGLLVMLAMSICFLVWIYKAHQDLQVFIPGYPVSPGGAMARLLIPLYNLYGYWHVWKTAGDYLPIKAGGRAIEEILPWFYGSFLAARVMSGFANAMPDSLWVDLISTVADLVMYGTLYLLYEAMVYGLNKLRDEMPVQAPYSN